jgi:uncharacterized membrane protein
MNPLEMATEFFGWCTVINVGILIFAAIFLVFMRSAIASVHGKMFKLSEEDLSRAYFQYLAQYKIAIFVFNLAPYFALKIVS